MSPSSSELDRLISRYLDDEASPRERRELQARMEADPAVEALVEEYAEIDRQVGHALRQVLGRTTVLPAPGARRGRAGQLVALAAAACLALMVWLTPGRQAAEPGPGRARAAASWFAPQMPRGDVVRSVNPSYERPQLQLRNTDRDWIIIPGQRPGEYLLIEVDRVRTHAFCIQNDF